MSSNFVMPKQIISGAGALNDAKDVLNVRIDRNRKIPGTVLLRALGLSSNEDILMFLVIMNLF